MLVIGRFGVADFKPPDVIAKFSSTDESGISQIGQIAENGRLIEADRDKHLGNLCVRQW